MELSSILKFLDNKAILITGGAGFLAKIFAEKVLRTQPNVKKIYLLVRAADNKSASLRLQNEVIGKDLFKLLKQKMGANFNSFISEKVVMVPGDITCEDLAIKESKLKEELWEDVGVIVNLAATTNFDERYDVSLYLNTFGAKHVLDFAKKCTNLKVLLQVSTAYVSGEIAGVVKEDPYYNGESLNGRPGLDIEEEKKLIEEKLEELQADGATEENIKLTLKIWVLKGLGIGDGQMCMYLQRH
ncbi:Alcohol-forming fatty acyl-CoA reductase [Bienertia sinuspersici]